MDLTHEDMKKYIQSLELEYLEYQEQAKEYEQTLEQELSDYRAKELRLVEKIENLEEENKKLRDRCRKDQLEISSLQKELDTHRSTLKKHEDRRRELEDLNDQWENSRRILEFSNKDLEERLYLAEENMIMYKEELDEVTSLKEAELQRYRDEVKDLKHELKIQINQQGDFSKITELESALDLAQHEKNEIQKELEKLRKGETELESATVSVYVKIRPFLPMDCGKNCGVGNNENSVIIMQKGKQGSRSYEFHKVFGPKQHLDEIFNELLGCIHHFVAGGTSCLMSYGQTGSGKSYTMSGLMNRTLDLLSSILSKDAKVAFHCIEVYNEQARNLLSGEILSKNWKDFSVSQVSLQGDWYQSVKKLIIEASIKRVTKSTDCNEQSSRSHCIYTLFLSLPNRSGIIQFVDLAGSERISKSSVTGDTLKEALHINKSLSALQDVIAALESKSNHVPYRNSLLTRILKLSLCGASSKVSVILNCSPTEDSINETISTLTLGQRLKSIDLSWAIRKNIKTEEVERTLDLLEKERSEKIAALRKLERYERDIDGYMTAIKDKDTKINSLASKLKQIEKTASDEIYNLKKDLQTSKSKTEEISKKFNQAKQKITKQKTSKPNMLTILSSNKTKINLNTSSFILNQSFSNPLPTSPKLGKDFLNPSRIPRPANLSCNTSKLM